MSGETGFQLRQGGPEVYEICRVRAQMGSCADELCEVADVGPRARVLDVACGTGAVARAAAFRTGTAANVTGTDFNAGMLHAAARFAAEVGFPDIDWIECDAADMPIPDAAFDVALCQLGLQFMPDQQGALTEMARVLRSDGRLALSVWKTRAPSGAAFATVLDRQFGKGTTAPWELIYSLGDRPRLHDLANSAGFRDVHVSLNVKFARHPDPEAFITGAIAGSPIAETMADLPDAERAGLVREIVAELAEYQDDDGLASPAECQTLTARK